MNNKIVSIKKLINNYKNDYEYWNHGGNEEIYSLLNAFNNSEWDNLKDDLINWTNDEHSIFSRAILFYNTTKVDIFEIFFTEFVLITDPKELVCLSDDLMYLPHIKKPTLSLLKKVKEKIVLLENYNEIGFNKDNIKRDKFAINNLISVVEQEKQIPDSFNWKVPCNFIYHQLIYYSIDDIVFYHENKRDEDLITCLIFLAISKEEILKYLEENNIISKNKITDFGWEKVKEYIDLVKFSDL